MSVSVSAPRIDDFSHRTVIGLGNPTPTLGWTISGNLPPAAYEIRIVTSDKTEWLSGRLVSSRTTGIAWPWRPLQSREQVSVEVRVWDTTGSLSDWGPATDIEAGLLFASDWTSAFVSPSLTASAEGARPAYHLRAPFTVVEEFVRARLYITAHGVFEAEINAQPVSMDVLAPGWTSYKHRLRYQTYDITGLLSAGENVLGVWLADGWYRGRLGFNGGLWNNYGDDVAVLAQLELTTASGSVHTMQLDPHWSWAASPITAAGIYEGESYDARLSYPKWSSPGFDAQDWQPVHRPADPTDHTALVAPTGPAVRVIEEISPTSLLEVRPGVVRVDFGQNITGKLRIQVNASSGHRITMRHAEVLEDGHLALRPLRSASATDTFISSGDPADWTPKFTLHGFRYAELEGWTDSSWAVTALVVHSDMKRTGYFTSSNELLNQLHSNVVWSMRDNFVDLPTDCPQRDERLGWTGDIQVFASTAAFLYDVQGFLRSWLRDLSAEQGLDGGVPNFVPWIDCGFPESPAAVWGDAAVMVPWTLYQHGADSSILEGQYLSMKAWGEYIHAHLDADAVWSAGFQLGDWLDPTAPPEDPAAAQTDPYLVATAYAVRTFLTIAKTASLLGNANDADLFEEWWRACRAGFQKEFVSPAGRLASDSVTAYALAIEFDLLDEQQLVRAYQRLRHLVAEADYTISTGFVGTPLVCDALVKAGSVDDAYHLLLQTKSPSWLYPITMGATTIWERWDSLLPDGSVNPGEMTSFNHYALGAVADFLHRVVAGIQISEPGYGKVLIAPCPGGGLSHAGGVLESPKGLISTSWFREGATFILDVSIPAGSAASVRLPDGTVHVNVPSGTHTYRCQWRPIYEDPDLPVRFNIHDPAHRELMGEQSISEPL